MKAVLFDLGETLYSYEGLPLSWKDHYQAAWKRALQMAGLDCADYDLSLAAAHMEKFNTRIVIRDEEFSSDHIFDGALLQLKIDQIHREKIVDAYFGYFRQALRPYPESRKVLEILRRNGIRTGALTDVAYGMPAHFVEDDLRLCGILDLLDVWFTSVHVGYRKPHPRGFLTLCEALEIAPSEAIYVGNEEKDVVGAKNAGLTAALVNRTPGAKPEWRQDHTITSLLDCLEILELGGQADGYRR
ncbi:HAD family hydrolase [Telmatospirillum siberiense]|nr:HAD family hydrolase [Telmatospirillum siberiense]